MLPDLRHDSSLSQAVYRAISASIASGELAVGAKITESGIAKAMGISRAPVREAFKQLAEDHLVTLVPRSRCFVAGLGPVDIAELYEIRKRLECMALEYAGSNFDIGFLRELRARFAALGRISSAKDARKEIALDMELHDMISERSGCPNLCEILSTLRARIQMMRIREMGDFKLADNALREHIGILDALIRGDITGGAALMTEHLENSKRNLVARAEVRKDRPQVRQVSDKQDGRG